MKKEIKNIEIIEEKIKNTGVSEQELLQLIEVVKKIKNIKIIEDVKMMIKNIKISEHELPEFILKKLREKRYLLVLDDVWRASREEDFLTSLGFPSGIYSNCKIVVTTRSKVVCRNLNAQMYEMQHMSDEDSWRLFCVYAFEENIEPHQQLKELGRQIVKQCGSLPLAIKTIAASLANTTDLEKWELKLRQLEQVIISIGDNDPIMDILKLSYDCLPARLKACFAYLSFFPEDEEIDPEYLINLWIGEGFIPAGDDQLDVAWDCVHQLANLCLLQLWEDSDNHYDDKLTKHCKIHDLLLDLAIHISKENKCACSVKEASTNTSDGTGWCRLLLAKKDIHDNAISESRPVCLRTLSLSQNRRITSTPPNLFTAMRGLRVLDLSCTGISTLPASVGKMKLLKVLNLRETKIMEVPECVRHLKSLLFLALHRCDKLPVWISELQCLQHLECKVYWRMPKAISKLASLRTLRVQGYLSTDFEDSTNMTQLQELQLYVYDEMELKRLQKGILAKLVKMRRLVLKNEMWVGSEIDLPHIPENMIAMKHLESLHLEFFAVPSWICGLANLRELQLKSCDCGDYPELQRLPNLVSLILKGNRRCRELPKSFGKSGGFPHLRFFRIEEFSELVEFPELEEGAMACLEELKLVRCPNVKKVGKALERLRRLKSKPSILR